MNEEELAAIEQRIAEPKPLRTGDMLDLIAEVRRLTKAHEDARIENKRLNKELVLADQVAKDWHELHRQDSAELDKLEAQCAALREALIGIAWVKAKGE